MRMATSDESLAKAAANGDAAAFSTLLERCYDRLFALAFRLTGSRADAEDLTQDICAALPARIGAYRGEAKFTTWLYRVTVNAAHDRRRRQVSHSRAAQGWGSWEIARRDAATQAAERAGWLMRAMAGLPDDLRDTLALVLDEMTHAQAAEVLGISEGTVSWRISEAKKRLRDIRQAEDQP